jgi:hypothetical protein
MYYRRRSLNINPYVNLTVSPVRTLGKKLSNKTKLRRKTAKTEWTEENDLALRKCWCATEAYH